MQKLKKISIRFLIVIGALYISACAYLYFAQESILFIPEKLDTSYKFEFAHKFEEINLKAGDGVLLNGLWFKADSSKGLIFYLHGNAGSLRTWGDVASTYLAMNYDVFIPDYRGYGKSGGEITEEETLYSDVQLAYDEMKKKYPEDKIIVLGYSIGTGPAAKVASVNKPKLLILQAPYFSMTDMMEHQYPIIPAFLLNYKLATNEYVAACKMPIVIFHGDKDEIIYYESSVKLKALMKPGDTLITLAGQKHNGMTDNAEYRRGIKRILGE